MEVVYIIMYIIIEEIKNPTRINVFQINGCSRLVGVLGAINEEGQYCANVPYLCTIIVCIIWAFEL